MAMAMAAEPVLTAEDHAFWEQNGYLVIREAVPREDCEATVAALFDFLGMDAGDPLDWFRPPLPGGVPMDLHPTVWRNRQSSRLYRAFSELWGAEALYVSRDRILFKHPVLEEAPAWGQKESPHPFGGFLHWDWGGWVDENASMLERPWFKVQGMLALADTSAEQGGFQCVPGVHRKLPDLFEAIPALREPGNQGMATIAEHLDAATLARLGLEVRRVPLRAGELVVWHHCTL